MFNNHQHLLDISSSAQRTPDNELDFIRDEEFDSNSGADNMEAPNSGDDDQADPNQPPNKKKRYHRHTQNQIQEMESFYKECNHPDDKQRKELGRRLGLEPLQVKFWFQNKRTQMKAQHERCENTQLRNENEKLRAENIRYKEALSNAACPNCGGPAAIGEMSFDEHQLRIENARLRDEIDRITGIAGKYVGKSALGYSHQLPLPQPEAPRVLDLAFGPQSGLLGEMYAAGDLLRTAVTGLTDAEKPVVIELAVTAMEELIRMAQTEEPLWLPSSGSETLCEQEYARIFPRGLGPKPATLNSEASRESAVVIMNHINLVEILMDVNQWTTVFAGLVSKAMTLEVLSTGVAGNHNGALQVMTAEFQVPSPLVPTRENYFLRYCKQHGEGTWVVVDVSLDNLRTVSVPRCRRRPSGCLIQEMPNGYSRVIWVEHVEVDENAVHDIYKPLVNSGIAFGAKRWVATLDRQCERLASVLALNIPTGDVGIITSPAGRKSMLKLAERMVMSFCAGVGASTTHIWTTLSGSGADDVRVMTRKSIDDPGRPPGIVLSAATSFWLPVSPKRVFDFLRDENSRNEWDILSNGGIVQEMAHIANGRDPGNCVSLLRVNTGTNSNQSNMLILQESTTDVTGSYVIYAPVDIALKRGALNLAEIQFVVLDEADQMLNVGFAEDVETILENVPQKHQTLMFSATMPSWILKITNKFLKNPVHIDLVGDSDQKLADGISLFSIACDMHQKPAILGPLITEHAKGGKCIVFTQTKRDADKLSYVMQKSFNCEALHGDISQTQRERTLSGFRQGQFNVLVATDVAARGLDVPNVDLVVHYELPNSSEIFVHRSGRTGRAGKKGSAILIHSSGQHRDVKGIERDVGCRFIELPRIEVEAGATDMFSDMGRGGGRFGSYGGMGGGRFGDSGSGRSGGYGNSGGRFGGQGGYSGRTGGFGGSGFGRSGGSFGGSSSGRSGNFGGSGDMRDSNRQGGFGNFGGSDRSGGFGNSNRTGGFGNFESSNRSSGFGGFGSGRSSGFGDSRSDNENRSGKKFF